MTDRSPDENPSPFRRPGWVASAALLVAVLVVGAAVIFWPRGSDDPDPPPTSATEPTTHTTEPTDPDASICGLEPGDQTVPAAAPQGASWSLHGTFAAPSIESVGPGLTDDDGLTHCFAHSPTGALLAAINAVAVGQLDPAWAYDLRIAADTPERQAAADEFAAGDSTNSQGLFQLRGFQVAEPSTTGDITIELWLSIEDTGDFVMTFSMRWEGGDWKYVVPTPGTNPLRPASEAELTSFVDWAGA